MSGKTFERYNGQLYDQPGQIERYAQTKFGMDAATLDRNLAIMGEVSRGSLSGASRQWLLAQAQRTGVPQQVANKMIQDVLSLPSPEARARAFVAARGAPAHVVAQAMELHKDYAVQEIATPLEEKLSARDAVDAKAGTQFLFEDSTRLKEARQTSGDVRKSIEAAMVSSGMVAPPARSLADHQARAMAYAHRVADRLESRKSDEPLSLRDAVEDAYLAQDALGAKDDAGISGPATLADVGEMHERQNSYGASIIPD